METNEPTQPTERKKRDRRGRNGLRHGLRAIQLGGTPRGASYVGRLTKALRTQLEQAIVDSKGVVSLTDACAINTACRWERHAMLAGRWLRLEHDSLTPDQRLNFSREVARASASRDAAIRTLQLDQPVDSILAGLYGPVITSDAG